MPKLRHITWTWNRPINVHVKSFENKFSAVVVAQLVEWSLLTPERSVVQIQSVANFIYFQLYWNSQNEWPICSKKPEMEACGIEGLSELTEVYGKYFDLCA